MMAGIERWESHECNKPGQLQTDYRVYKKRFAERTETTVVVQGVMVETWKYGDEDYVFEFGHDGSANVRGRETHNCIGGSSRSACRFGRVSELTLRSATPPLSSRTGSSTEARKYTGENVDSTHWSSQVSWFLSGVFRDWNRMRYRLRSLVRVDSQDRCCILQELHCWLTKREIERLVSKQTGESRSRANRL